MNTFETKPVDSFNRLLVRSSVFSLTLGADKLFHIVNWGKGTEETLNTNAVYGTLVKYMNDFDGIEILNPRLYRK